MTVIKRVFRLIVAGGRDFNDAELLDEWVSRAIPRMTKPEIVCGMANGADTLGEVWALDRGHWVKYFPAYWDKHGKKAGYLRNEEMAKYADALLAFWDGKSKGTKHMIDLAKKHNLKVKVVRYE
jgi:hypothetical protein